MSEEWVSDLDDVVDQHHFDSSLCNHLYRYCYNKRLPVVVFDAMMLEMWVCRMEDVLHDIEHYAPREARHFASWRSGTHAHFCERDDCGTCRSMWDAM
jgi:hypothetical protein